MGNLINLKLKQVILEEITDILSRKYKLNFAEQKMIIEDLYLATKLFDNQNQNKALFLTNLEIAKREQEAKFKEEGK